MELVGIEWKSELISAGILIPVVWYLLRQQNNLTMNVINQQIEQLKDNINKTTLTEHQTIRLLKSEMWLVSRSKLAFIKSILTNNHIKGREDFIYDKIKAGLEGFSQEYYGNFKTYQTPIGDLGKWLDINFNKEEFENFVRQIWLVVIREDEGDKQSCINDKVNEISLIMETEQINLSNKLKNDLINKQ